jgi:hypothetical protein
VGIVTTLCPATYLQWEANEMGNKLRL